ncbi:aspartate aminotransferase family protein [Caldibacillus lycopersici]|uniref:Aspartate aminotransferase family protein n=1 Tax=Perspicuibacillus lycopersici TaxID=1325689 RepID=A0AAE3IUF6_9BACI|nr:aspartate aminotransferase family protein [Perspicuibacillus lycopersici]MCU9613626.1 aspartate aminotransferase family protein [Perspicuibacillus lycopersici]
MNKSYVIKPIVDEELPMISHGSGIYLYDVTGKEYIDGCSGAVTANIGHGIQEVLNKINEQGKRVSFVYRSQFTNEAAEQLAKKLIDSIGSEFDGVFFVNSGSEATETALKIAIQYWQEKGNFKKTRVISRWLSYHGITNGALSMSGHPLRRDRFTELLQDYPTLNPPYCYRCPFQLNYPECQLQCANELELMIERIGADHIAAFIAEPIIGAAGGAVTPPKDYYGKIAEICKKYDILFIADEVMTGCGRTGKMLGIEHWGVVPDIVALGKGLSAGYSPLAATIVHKRILEPIRSGSKSIMSGHTLSANPASTAAGLAVLEFLESNKVIEAVGDKGEYLINQLKSFQGKYHTIGDVRGLGLLIGLEIVLNRITKQPFPRSQQATFELIRIAKEKGLLLYPSQAGNDGIHGDAVIVAPPLTITKEEIDELILRLEQTMDEFEAQMLDERGRE